MIISTIFLILMSLMKNKLELVLFEKIWDIISQTGNVHKKAYCMFLKLCLQYIKIQKTIHYIASKIYFR